MSDQPKPRKTLRRVLTIFLLIGVCLVLTVVLLYLEEIWRGWRNWEQCKRDLERQGEKLDGSSFIPASVPDEQNFAMAPLFAPLNDFVKDPKSGEEKPRDAAAVERLKSVSLNKLNVHARPMPNRYAWKVGRMVRIDEWQLWLAESTEGPKGAKPENAARDVLAALQKYSAQLEEFRVATERPLARFPLQYEKGPAVPLPHIGVLKGFSVIFSLRALAELETGDTETALRDAKLIDRIGMAVQAEPLMISYVVRLGIVDEIAQMSWRGIAEHRWNDAQLLILQNILARDDLLSDYERIIRSERALTNDYFESIRWKHLDPFAAAGVGAGIEDSRPKWESRLARLVPASAIFYQNQVIQNRLTQDLILPVIDPAGRRAYPRRQAAADEILRQTRTTPYNFLAKLILPVYSSISVGTCARHMSLRQAMVACAIERFRLRRGQLPENLKDLVPDYLPRVEQDIFVDEPLHYRREAEGKYILYSVGWNQQDEDGVVATKPGNADRRDDQSGDWVWFGTGSR